MASSTARTALVAALVSAAAATGLAARVDTPYTASASLVVGLRYVHQRVESPRTAARRIVGLGVAAAAERCPGASVDAVPAGVGRISVAARAPTATCATALLEAMTRPVLELHRAWRDTEREISRRNLAFFEKEAAAIEARLEQAPEEADTLITPLALSRLTVNGMRALASSMQTPETALLSPRTERDRRPFLGFGALGALFGVAAGLLFARGRAGAGRNRLHGRDGLSADVSDFAARHRRLLLSGAALGLLVGLGLGLGAGSGGARYSGRLEVASAAVAIEGPIALPDTELLRLEDRLEAELARSPALADSRAEAALVSAADEDGGSDIIAITASGPDPAAVRALLEAGRQALASGQDPAVEAARARIKAQVASTEEDLAQLGEGALDWESRMTRARLAWDLAMSERALSPSRMHETEVLVGPTVEAEPAAARIGGAALLGLLSGVLLAAGAAMVAEGWQASGARARSVPTPSRSPS
jgi:hypothetical protein